MKILKQAEGSKIVLYSFESSLEFELTRRKLLNDLVFFGHKAELLKKDDSFWEPLVEEPETEWYKNYQEKGYWHKSPSESGRSAIEDIKGEFILIVEEKI